MDRNRQAQAQATKAGALVGQVTIEPTGSTSTTRLKIRSAVRSGANGLYTR